MDASYENFVAGPFNSLIADCYRNVLLALRIADSTEHLPPPSKEEVDSFLFSFSFEPQPDYPTEVRPQFKNWILRNGFKDVHKATRLLLERFLILNTFRDRLRIDPHIMLGDIEQEQTGVVTDYHFPVLVERVETAIGKPLDYRRHILSFNLARNVFEHSNSHVIAKYCNAAANSELVLYCQRFRFYFKNESMEVPAEIGKPGPPNAALMLGAESKDLVFRLGERIELSFEDFRSVLETCVFLRADVLTSI